MDRNEILKRVEAIFRKELENDGIVLTFEATVNDVEGWDSRSHGQLAVALQDDFAIEFDLLEIISWQNVGDIVDSIEKKL